jgi:hypothetical protein
MLREARVLEKVTPATYRKLSLRQSNLRTSFFFDNLVVPEETYFCQS